MRNVADGPPPRIVEGLGVDLVDALVSLPPTDLQSVLLEVHRRLADGLTPHAVLERHAQSRFLHSAPVDQNKVVTADRNVEVVSDSTNVLALEAALRRRAALPEPHGAGSVVRLAASQRQVRAQRYGDPRTPAHFGLLAVVAAGRATPRSSFECGALVEQVEYFVSLLRRWRPAWTVEVVVTDFAGRSRLLEEQVLAPLGELAPHLDVRVDFDRQEGRGYYLDLCYKLHVVTESGASVEVADGGSTDWTRKLLSDRRERLVIGGLGTERLLV